MPNTPASLGMSASALTHNNLVDEKDKKEAEKIFSSVGITCWLEEKFFDLYTALIGSGPAYIFYLIEALQESAQKIELSDNLIKNLIIQMIKGSASLAKRSEDSPSKLRERVTWRDDPLPIDEDTGLPLAKEENEQNKELLNSYTFNANMAFACVQELAK